MQDGTLITRALQAALTKAGAAVVPGPEAPAGGLREGSQGTAPAGTAGAPGRRSPSAAPNGRTRRTKQTEKERRQQGTRPGQNKY